MTATPSDPALRFEILGDVRALRGTEEVDLGPAKQRAVLAVLLLNAGRPVPSHQIVDAVWGDEPPENGSNVVQKYVAGLRRVLEPDRSPRTPGELIALANGGYVLRVDAGALDADRFQAGLAQATTERKAGQLAEAADTLRRALQLWRGEALAGLTGPAFDSARTRLTEARATAWEKWADIELARGNHTGLMPDLVRLVEQFPLREGLRAQLMIALHQGGRQAEALAAFRDARAYFLEEFGVEPGERMQETHRKILRGEPFYSEPVDPWADSDDIPAPRASPENARPAASAVVAPPGGYVQQYVPPDVTEVVPDRRPAPGPARYPIGAAAWGLAPPAPPAYAPPRKRFPVGEVIMAAVLPIIICSFGSWIYFVYAGIRRQERRQFLFALGYAALFVVAFVIAASNPSPVDSPDLNPTEWIAFTMFAVIAIASAVHGAVLASHPGDSPRSRTLRDQARQFATFDPERARALGIGRPDLMRAFDDGGLVDVNHVPGNELARLPGISSEQAHGIVIDRLNRGPYAQPEDLVIRGVLPMRAVNRLSSKLICLPVAQHGTPPGGWPAPYPSAQHYG
ncbi:BTAD domain-containing putative transcriptional regulator [Actinoplanes sp. NPDC048967]|uniref:BTAD domain-containing putative transcriptional regulator n=1 Tax=Actinoplanes sp. NPDC048967 TaxID=3155269 RepID=UPI0033FBA5D3